jgi:hypothetical protein
LERSAATADPPPLGGKQQAIDATNTDVGCEFEKM